MPTFRQRKNLRLADFDYGATGAYFVTVCTHGQRCLFGSCRDGVVYLSEVGRTIELEWQRSAEIRSEIELDEFVVMPNHLHGIVWIQSDGRTSAKYERSLGSLMSGFKAACTKFHRRTAGPNATLWQGRYFDHVIRNDESLRNIRRYIRNNPLRWHEDPENPTKISR